MISQQELLDMVCTEAAEYGGLQEIPGHKHGAKQFFHAAKHVSRGSEVCNGDRSGDELKLHYPLRLVREESGVLRWED